MVFVVLGVMAGILSGLFGIGGGIIIVPGLLLLARMTPERATGTSLAALLLPVGALGAWHYYSKGFVDVRAGLLIAVGLSVGAFLGAQLGVKLPAPELQRAFAVFLASVAVYLWAAA